MLCARSQFALQHTDIEEELTNRFVGVGDGSKPKSFNPMPEMAAMTNPPSW